MTPTEQDMNRAKEYLLLRLRAERLMASELDDALVSAARRIAEISLRYGIPPEKFRFSANPALKAEVASVLALLREALYSRIKELDTFAADDGGTFAAPALTSEDHGKTLRQRLAEYASRWGYETEAAIAAAGLEGVRDKDEIARGIADHLDRPYDNPWVKSHMGEGEAARLREIPSYGKGTPISARAALAALATFAVARGWMQNWARVNAGRRGFYVFRGSSFPCETCDAQTGFLHDASDEMGAPPFHLHCKCFTVYID